MGQEDCTTRTAKHTSWLLIVRLKVETGKDINISKQNNTPWLGCWTEPLSTKSITEKKDYDRIKKETNTCLDTKLVFGYKNLILACKFS